MDRRRKMMQKRRAKQRRIEDGLPLSRNPRPDAEEARIPTSAKLVFKPGTAGIQSIWVRGKSEGDPPPAPEDQP